MAPSRICLTDGKWHCKNSAAGLWFKSVTKLQVKITVLFDVLDQSTIGENLGHNRRQRFELPFHSVGLVNQRTGGKIDGKRIAFTKTVCVDFNNRRIRRREGGRA